MRFPLTVALLPALALAAPAQTAPFAGYAAQHAAQPSTAPDAAGPGSAHSDREQTLPIRSVSLYTNGVAFIELAGTVHGDALIRIDLTTAQLNDALTSLTAWDLNGGKVTGTGYHAAPSFANDVHAVLPNLGPNPGMVDVLRALKGKPVEVRTGKTVATGRVLGVEIRTASPPAPRALSMPLPPPATERILSLVTDSGSIRTVELTSSVEIRVLGPDGKTLTHALHLVDNATPPTDLRHLVIEDRGAGARELHVSYLTAAPAWKSTYRALFDGRDATHATLQGWAVIDNTSADDWKNVNITLVSGAPQSFIQQISRPLTFLRQQLPMPQPGTPQHLPSMPLGAMADPLSGTATSAVSTNAARLGGAATQSQATPPPPAKQPESAAQDDVADLPTAPATTRDLGDLFEYHLARPVSIASGQSLNVPILETSLASQRVTVWSPHEKPRPAMRAMYFVNTSGLTLDRGSLTVLEGNAFAGEGELDLTHPAERAIVRYATDESIHINEFNPWKQPEPYIRHYEVKDGTLTIHRRTPRERDFIIRNTGGAQATVVIQITGTDHWNTDPGATQPTERIGNLDRFEVPAPPAVETTFRFVETHSSPKVYKLAELSAQDLHQLIEETGNDPGFTTLLQPFVDARKQLADLNKRLDRNGESTRLAEIEQSRIRANMAALPIHGDASLSRRYSDEMSQQEDKLHQLHGEKESLLQQQHDIEDGVTTRAAALPPANTKLRS
jgi:hypothetical protein